MLTVSFHPDRAVTGGITAARGLALDGVYRTQFETGPSSGGLDTVLDGARTRWERRMFGGAYDAALGDRPRYGGLDLLPHPDGCCPRYGSTHLRLHRRVLERTTFSWGDSVTEPTAVGTWHRLHDVIDAARHAGEPELDGAPRTGPDRLDRYVEAQIHGGLTMSDVEAVVTDPSYRGSAVATDLARACEAAGAALPWHAGYALAPDALDPDFRGPEAVRLARMIHDRLGTTDVLDPALLSRAAAAIVERPRDWAGTPDPTRTLQQLTYVWHHLAAFGYR